MGRYRQDRTRRRVTDINGTRILPMVELSRLGGRPPASCGSVDRYQLLDAQPAANLRGQLFGVTNETDLVVVGIVIVHRGRHAMVDAAMRADPALLEPLIVVDQIV